MTAPALISYWLMKAVWCSRWRQQGEVAVDVSGGCLAAKERRRRRLKVAGGGGKAANGSSGNVGALCAHRRRRRRLGWVVGPTWAE
uniref:DUF834 domain-containing protein n=1 Tax=Oryza nivara TaxID=4536 RepID=A0A0E0IPH0_ORYNI